MITPLSDDLRNIQSRVEEFFADPKWSSENGEFEFCRSFVAAMGKAGLLSYLKPPLKVQQLCFLRYEIAQKTALGDLLFAMQGLGSFPIALAGTEAQKEKYVDAVVRGESVAAFAMTEPEAGSDAASMSLRAEKTEGGYRLNGRKTFISNAGLANFYSLFARTSEGPKGVTAFIVDAETPRLTVHPQELIAVHPIGELELQDCFIPESQRLGAEGEGLKIAYSTLDVFRSSVGAAAIGLAERAFQEAIAYAKKRRQFQQRLADFQAIQFKIAEMAQQLQGSKLLIWDAATKKDAGAKRITLESAIAKSYATEAAQQIIDQSLQIHGGAGLIRGSITERLYRDIRALRIYEGTTEILKGIIAQQYLGELEHGDTKTRS